MNCEFDQLIELAQRLGLVIRHARLGGSGGGIAHFKGQRQLFIDLEAAPADQLEQTARAMANLPELETQFIRPDVRRLLEEWGRGGQGRPKG
jgi:hypothetical protein